MSIIEVKNFSFFYERQKALNNINFSVNEGEFISIIGPNGSGKTTLLKCLMRINSIGKGGEIKIFGRNLQKFSQKELAKIMSYVPQVDYLPPFFTVYEFLQMSRYPYLSFFNSVDKNNASVIEWAAEMTEISDLTFRCLGTLSGGERKRVLIAASLVQQPHILLLDELDAFLDPCNKEFIYKLIMKLNREIKLTIISVTHDVNLALLFSNRILALKAGEMIYYGNSDDLISGEMLFKIYNRKFIFFDHPCFNKRFVVSDFF